MQIRHGNILLERADLPHGAKVLEAGAEIVLSHSETGHHHVVRGGVALLERDAGRYVEVGAAGATLVHLKTADRHADIAVEPGTYRVTPQQEWDLSDEWREVVD
jgi:hypothetical protein